MKILGSSHNHGFVENGVLEDVWLVSKWAIFHFHDSGRKGNSPKTSMMRISDMCRASGGGWWRPKFTLEKVAIKKLTNNRVFPKKYSTRVSGWVRDRN